jgi:hypothetical protein
MTRCWTGLPLLCGKCGLCSAIGRCHLRKKMERSLFRPKVFAASWLLSFQGDLSVQLWRATRQPALSHHDAAAPCAAAVCMQCAPQACCQRSRQRLKAHPDGSDSQLQQQQQT